MSLKFLKEVWTALIQISGARLQEPRLNLERTPGDALACST